MGENKKKNSQEKQEHKIKDEVLENIIEETDDELNEDQLKEAQEKRDEYMQSLMRLQAEFDNYRKRANQEKEMSYTNGYGEAIKNVLPVLDNLSRAIESAIASGNDEIAKGLKMCNDQILADLAKQGLQEIETQDVKFDPLLHNAVIQEPCDDGDKSGYVAGVLQKGYMYKGKILRHSTVNVYE